MTISTTVSRLDYLGNGATTAFPVTFVFFGAAELTVIERDTASGVETTLTLGGQYTVSGGSGSTGTVTATAAPASGKQWTIIRETDALQSISYQANDAFPASTHERALDRLTAVAQELGRDAARSIRAAATDATTGLDLAPSVTRATTLLGFDAAGAIYYYPVPTVTFVTGTFGPSDITLFGASLLSSANAAAARTLLLAYGAGSAMAPSTVAATGAISTTSSITAGGTMAAAGTITATGYAASPAFVGRTALGTAGSPTVVNVQTQVFQAQAQGYDGAAYRSVAVIDAYSDAAVASGSSPGFLRLLTTPSGSVTPVERLRIGSGGWINTGAASGSAVTGYGNPGDIALPSTGGIRAKNTIKAWVEFNGTGTVAIRDSFNVSSITDNGTGDYSVNFTNAMADTNYAVLATAGGTAGSGAVKNGDETAARTTSVVRILALNATGTATFDSSRIAVAVIGA